MYRVVQSDKSYREVLAANCAHTRGPRSREKQQSASTQRTLGRSGWPTRARLATLSSDDREAVGVRLTCFVAGFRSLSQLALHGIVTGQDKGLLHMPIPIVLSLTYTRCLHTTSQGNAVPSL